MFIRFTPVFAIFLCGTLAAEPAPPAVRDARMPPLHDCDRGAAWGRPLAERSVRVVGTTPVNVDFPVPGGEPLFIDVAEQGIDVLVEASEPGSGEVARADNPIRRTGTRRLVYRPTRGSTLRLHVTGKEHPAVHGLVTIRVFGRGTEELAARCRVPFRLLAAADSDYASGQDVTLGRSTGAHLSARHFYLRAAEGYLAASQGSGQAVVAEAELALAATYYQDIKDWRRAANWATRARDAAHAAGNEYDAARAEALLAASWIESPPQAPPADSSARSASRSRFDAPRELLRRLEAFHVRRGEAYDAALQYNNIGVAYFNEGEFDRAEAIYGKAVRRFAVLHEAPLQGLSLQNVATCEWGRGELTRAERTFRLARRYLGPSPYPKSYLLLLSNHALISHELGHLDTALRLESETLRMAERLELQIPAGVALHGLGITYYALGDRDQSRYYLERAVRNHTPDVRSYVSTLRALATVYREAGRAADSHRVAAEALALATSASAQARIRVGLALDDAALGRSADALRNLDEVLAGAAAQNATIRVDALLARGDIRRVAGDLAGAQGDFQQALGLLAALEDPTSEYRARLGLGRIHQARGERQEALEEVDRALRLADLLRRDTANPELRAQRQEPLRAAYELKIALLLAHRAELLRSGDAANAAQAGLDALTVAEESRAQSLADFAVQSAGPAGAADALIRRRAQLYTEIAGRRFQLDARRDAAGDDDPRARRYQAELASLRRDLDDLNATLARATGHAAARARPEPSEWVRWLRQHAPQTAILEFWLGESSASAWVVSAAGVELHALGDTATIAADALALHASMRDFATTPVATRRTLTESLSTRLLGPLGAEALAHRSLIIVPDRALAYVPFPALLEPRDTGRQPLVADHDLAVAPAAWWLFRNDRTARDAATRSRVLIVADPVYEPDDARLTAAQTDASQRTGPTPGADRAWTRLRWTAEEANSIAALFPARSVERLEGLTATRDRMLALPLGEYRYIHVASHGYVDARMPQLSAVVLGAYDDRGHTADASIRAADLLPLRLHSEVVTFSACDTALGKDVVGEGVVGLSYVALARGSRAVVASLWPVSDEMTVTIMTEFYRSLRDGPDAAVALGNAMRLALKQSPALDPALWAAYQVAIGGPLPARRDLGSRDVSSLKEDR